MCGRTRWSCKGLCSFHKVTCRCCAQLRDPLKILVRKSTAGRFLSLSPRRRLWPTSCADTRTQFNSTSPSTPTPRCSSSHIPTPLIKRRTTTIWWVVWMIHESIQQQWKTYSTVVSKPLWTHIVHKLEMVQEAAQRIKRYYRNTYTYGPGAATLCKTAFFLFRFFKAKSTVTWMCECFYSFFRPMFWRLWRLGVQTWHQILLYVWAPGPWGIRLPVTTFSHIRGLQRSAACGQDHCCQGFGENTSSGKPSHDLSSFVIVTKQIL